MASRNKPQVSRRDWILLRRSNASAWMGDSIDSPDNEDHKESQLTELASPPNHHQMDLSELPPVRQARLSPEEVLALIDDISSLATEVELRRRTSLPQTSGDAQAKLLHEAAQQFLAHQVDRLQVRYRWHDSLWIDTLQQHEQGIRLVRVAHSGPRS